MRWLYWFNFFFLLHTSYQFSKVSNSCSFILQNNKIYIYQKKNMFIITRGNVERKINYMLYGIKDKCSFIFSYLFICFTNYCTSNSLLFLSKNLYFRHINCLPHFSGTNLLKRYKEPLN